MLNHKYEYGAILEDALKVGWKVEDLIGGDKKLDFSRPFLPDSLAGVNGIKCLNDAEKLKLNQIRGNSYLYLFGFLEEFILPYVLENTQQRLHEDSIAVQALVTFAEEEAKHINLFQRFAKEFADGFSVKCGVISPAREVAAVLLRYGAMGVCMTILHLEWMTQRHYTGSVRSEEALDPLFSSLLRHHWMEEAQHAKLDTLILDELARKSRPEEIDQGFDDYFAIGGTLDGLLATQVLFDLESLSQATGRQLSEAERKEISEAQTKSYRWTFLGSGMTHPNFVKSLSELSPAGAQRVAEMASAFS